MFISPIVLLFFEGRDVFLYILVICNRPYKDNWTQIIHLTALFLKQGIKIGRTERNMYVLFDQI